MNSVTKKNTITLPKKTVRQMMEAISAFDDARDELESHLIQNNQKIMKDVARARSEHKEGKRADFSELKSSYGV